MNTSQKLQIKAAFLRYLHATQSSRFPPSQLADMEPGLLSKIRNNEIANVSEEAWQQLACQVGFYCGDWQAADTPNHLLMCILLRDAHNFGSYYLITGNKGSGKTFSALRYLRDNEQVMYFSGNAFLKKAELIDGLLKTAGICAEGSYVEQVKVFTDHIGSLDQPMIVVDDCHLMSEKVLSALLKLLGKLPQNIGVVLLGEECLIRKIKELVGQGQKSCSPIRLGPTSVADIRAISSANGVNGTLAIENIAAACAGELTHISNLVQRHLAIKAAA